MLLGLAVAALKFFAYQREHAVHRLLEETGNEYAAHPTQFERDDNRFERLLDDLEEKLIASGASQDLELWVENVGEEVEVGATYSENWTLGLLAGQRKLRTVVTTIDLTGKKRAVDLRGEGGEKLLAELGIDP